MREALFFTIWAAAAVVLAVATASWRRRLASAERLFEGDEGERPEVPRVAEKGLARWLFLAGYRSPQASAVFVLTTLSLVLMGSLGAYAIQQSGLVAAAREAAMIVPGGIADLAIPIIVGAPWIVFMGLVILPWTVVRRARRQRVESVERELPLVLEMLATLSEAGLGFDAAIARLLEAHPKTTPLYDELRLYQTELLAGTSRVTALRELRRRIDVGAVTVFISSLVQSEEVGSALTDVLRRQSEDAHARSRERALIKAEALPTKLVFPLVICYLPGLFVTTLGPTMLQFIKLADAFARGRGS